MKVSRLFEGGERRVKRKALPRIMVTMFLIGMLRTMSSVRLVGGWSNGGYSADPSNPDYGTHDWIAQHALDWLPTQEKQYILDNLAAYLYGTELPDNGGAPDGIGDTTKHHIYYNSAEVMTDDAAAVRASIEYSNTLSFLKAKDYAKAAKNAGIMSHYIVDVAVFGHVMGSSTEWGAEAHHSEYETYVNEQTSSYSGEFNSYLSFDGSLTAISAYDCAKDLAFDTTFDVDGDLTCVWMDQGYDWSNPTFKNRAGESLNLAVNYLTDVLHTIHLEATVAEPRTWTVDDDGPADFNTIQEAINAANPGDTILVYEGTYYEHVILDKTLSLIGMDKTATIIDGRGSGTVVYVTGNNVLVKGFTARNSGNKWPNSGVFLNESRTNRIIGNNLTATQYGLLLYFSNDTVVSDNIIANNRWIGVFSAFSSNNTVIGNKITNNTQCSILLHSSSNSTVNDNTMMDTMIGLDLHYSSNNSIFRNNIMDNEYGVYFASSSNNTVYNNSFVNNTNQGYIDYRYDSLDTWDYGYRSGGNYWSDYVGVDVKNGPYQNQSGSDGIGDTPYVIDANNQDRYPLMSPRIPPPDIIPPVTTISLSGVLGDNDWFTSGATVTLSATDNTEVNRTKYSFDSSKWTTYTTAFNITKEGNTIVYYKSIDKADNHETVKTKTIKIDKTLPSGSITVNNNATYATSTWVRLNLTANDATSGVYRVRYSNDGLWDTERWETPSPTKTWTLLSGAGTKTVYCQIKDNAGLVSTYSDAIILDATMPTAEAGQDQTVNVGAKVNFDASGSSDNVGITSYEWDFGDETKGTGKTTTHTYANTGTYAVKLTVKDEAGNAATDTIIIKVLQTEAFPTWVIGVAVVAIAISAATILFLKKRK